MRSGRQSRGVRYFMFSQFGMERKNERYRKTPDFEVIAERFKLSSNLRKQYRVVHQTVNGCNTVSHPEEGHWETKVVGGHWEQK